MAEHINFVDLVAKPLHRLESLLAAVLKLLENTGDETESHAFKLISMAQEQRQRVWDQLDKDIESDLSAEKTFASVGEDPY